jgi:hypothetical protein
VYGGIVGVGDEQGRLSWEYMIDGLHIRNW